MASKVLVEVVTPATGRKYDFWLAKKLTVERAIEKLTLEIKSYENNNSLFINVRDIILISSTNGVLDRKITLQQANIHSGDTLMII